MFKNNHYYSINKNIMSIKKHPIKFPLKSFCFSAFTLAEVLITLGIIGIVAALTIPNLVHIYKKKLIETRLEKAISAVTELVRIVDNNEGIINWRYTNQGNILTEMWQEQDRYMQIYLKYLSKNTRLCNEKNAEDKRECFVYSTNANGTETSRFPRNNDGSVRKILLPDGIGFYIVFPGYNSMLNGGIKPNDSIIGDIYIDLNISKNKMYNGIDFFMFKLVKTSQNTLNITSINNTSNAWVPYLPHCGTDINDKDGNSLNAIQLCENPSLDNWMGYPQLFCSAIIECHNWKVPDDYPIKF